MNVVSVLTKNENKAVELYQRAAEMGVAEAMTALGAAYELGHGGLPKDEGKAVELFQRAADLGHTYGMTHLALAYMFGRTGLAVNEKIAAELLQRAVDLGDPGALYMLASAYQVGAGVAKDSAKAKEFFAALRRLETRGLATNSKSWKDKRLTCGCCQRQTDRRSHEA